MLIFTYWVQQASLKVKKHLSTSFVFILETHPIKTSYSINTAFWLDEFGVLVQMSYLKNSKVLW
jgi:hypothetical protein